MLEWRRWQHGKYHHRQASGLRLPAIERAFERKVRLSKWALLFEQLWPRAWLVLGSGRPVHRRFAGRAVAEAAGAAA